MSPASRCIGSPGGIRTAGHMRAEHLLDDAAAHFALRTAVVSGVREYTYAELAHTADRAAAGLARHGIAQGERVALMLADNFEAVVSMFAVLKAGCVAVPLDGGARPDTLEQALRRSGASALITEVKLASAAGVALRTAPQVRLVVLAGGDRATTSESCLTFEGLTREAAIDAAVPMASADSDPALFLATAGAPPNAVTHAQLMEALEENVPAAAERFSILTRSGLCRLLAIVRAGATLVLPAPRGEPRLALAG